MDTERLRALLDEVRAGVLPVQDALIRLRDLPYEDLGFAKLDHHRTLRTGDPEVVYCPGKSIDQVLSIIERLRQRSSKVLATRATSEAAAAVLAAYPDSRYHETARVMVVPGVTVDRNRETEQLSDESVIGHPS